MLSWCRTLNAVLTVQYTGIAPKQQPNQLTHNQASLWNFNFKLQTVSNFYIILIGGPNCNNLL